MTTSLISHGGFREFGVELRAVQVIHLQSCHGAQLSLILDHVEGYLELSAKTKIYFVSAVALWDAEFDVKVDDDVHVNIGSLKRNYRGGTGSYRALMNIVVYDKTGSLKVTSFSNEVELILELKIDQIVMLKQSAEGMKEEVIFDHLHATTFQYTPFGRTILGCAENVRTITKCHLQNISTHYTAPRMVLFV